jgi:antibiotic biosynthesis monooxygenase (ABM) superfamily enzyme
MVLYILKWNIRPDQMPAYMAWAKGAIARAFTVPGLVEIRGYRPVTGTSQAVMTYEFADLATWQAWYEHQDIQTLMLELRAFTTDMNMELWGTSPMVPGPIRAGA